MLRNVFIGVALLGILSFTSQPISEKNHEKEVAIIDAVLKYLSVLHVLPQDINDDFSSTVFDEYLESLDGQKRFLTKDEVAQLEEYRYKIDDQINDRDLAFFDLSITLIDSAIIRSSGILNELKSHQFDLDKEESMVLNGDDVDYAKDEIELRDYWRKMLKLDVLRALDSKIEETEKDTVYTDLRSIDEIQSDAEKEIVKNYDRWFERLNKVRRSDRFANYVNAMTRVFDPHSVYFSPKEKEDFDIRMGGKLEGIGAQLVLDDDYVKVVKVITGGPAWKGKELKNNDLITAVRQDDEENYTDVMGMRLDDVVSKIRGDKGTTVHLKLKREDGTRLDISIVRDEVILDESFARSLVLDIPNQIENVGYIKLPKFYSTFERGKGNSCATDVAREIEKLKDLNVNGIILDLRNNGGGSLQDVITMSGLFVEDGPIVQVKSRGRDAQVYKDKDSDVQYDGALIVMVNEFSASASEILAAALQDYGRAIIVGSKSTFGKGTVQRFQNLDQYFRGNEALKPLGELKLTMQKFYRINGGSTQLLGVTPDIILPDVYAYMETGEKEYDHAIEWSQIEPETYEQNVYIVENVDKLRKQSEQRVRTNKTFELIDEQAKRRKERKDEKSVTLNLDKYRNRLDDLEEEAKPYNDAIDEDVECMVIKTLDVDSTYINLDEGRKARIDDWLDNTQKDVYLEEALYIMRDMLASKN